MLKVQPLFINSNNYLSFSKKKEGKSLVIEPPLTKPYSLSAELFEKNIEDKKIRQEAAKSLIYDNYRYRNTLKEKAMVFLPCLAAVAAVRFFAKRG